MSSFWAQTILVATAVVVGLNISMLPFVVYRILLGLALLCLVHLGVVIPQSGG